MARKCSIKFFAMITAISAGLYLSDACAQTDFAMGQTSLQERTDSAEIVAAIRVETAMEQINMALSKNGRFVSEGVRYGVTIEDVWKGVVPERDQLQSFSVSLEKCYKTLAAATEYLVFTQLGENGEFLINSCEDFVLLSEVNAPLAASAD